MAGRMRGGSRVGVDELPILGCLGKGVDPGLIDSQPGRNADFLTDTGADLIEAGERHARLICSGVNKSAMGS